MEVSCTKNADHEFAAIQERRRLAWAISLTCPLIVIIVFSVLRLNVGHVKLTGTAVITVLLIIVAAFYDIHWLKIPNWLTYPGVLWGLCINVLGIFVSEEARQSLGCVGLLESFSGLVVPTFFMFILFSATGGGAGDVKLIAALGALLGLHVAINAILISFVMAGAIALVIAIWKLGVFGFFDYVFRGIGSYVLPRCISRPSKGSGEMLKQPMPLAPSFAVGTIIAMMDSGAFDSWIM